MEGTPMTSIWPECPPEASMMYSSNAPVGWYVFTAATTSSFDSPRSLAMALMSAPPPAPAHEPMAASATIPAAPVMIHFNRFDPMVFLLGVIFGVMTGVDAHRTQRSSS